MAEPNVHRPFLDGTDRSLRGAEVWTQYRGDGEFEHGVQLNKDQFTYLEGLSRQDVERIRDNCIAALLQAG